MEALLDLVSYKNFGTLWLEAEIILTVAELLNRTSFAGGMYSLW
jgi:hypothetical protein